MNQTEFAKLLKVAPPLVTQWKQRGWLVMRGQYEVDAEASKVRLLEKRGTLGKIDKRGASQRSSWSKGPHCKTQRAFQIHREWNGG